MRFRVKIRHPWLIKAIGFAGARVLRCWLGTLDYRYRPLGPSVDPHQTDLPDRYIYAMWHETLLLPIQRYARPDISILISKHADGQLLTEMARHLNVRVVRGSTNRGGAEALRQLLRQEAYRHLALTPDGPRGPRRQVQPGLIYLSSRLGMPIVPVGFGFQKARRLQSWDRFALPYPWSRATCVTGTPIRVPSEPRPDQLGTYRLQVEQALEQATQIAQQWAETNTWPSVPSPVTPPPELHPLPLVAS